VSSFEVINLSRWTQFFRSHRKNDWENELNDKSWLSNNVKQKLLNTVYDDEPDDSLDEFQSLAIVDGETVDEEQETLRKSLTLRNPNPDEEEEEPSETQQQGEEDDEDTDEDTESNNNNNAQRGRGTVRGTNSRGRGERGAHRGRGRGNDAQPEQDEGEDGDVESSRGGRGGRGAPRGGRGGPRVTGATANKWKSHNRKEMSSRKRKL
jgi:hypothetical protein